jgi:dodecin
MALGKVYEILATSAHSFGDALRQGMAEADRTLRTLRRVWIRDQRMGVAEDSKPEYQVDLMVTFGEEDGVARSSQAEASGLGALDLERALSMADEGGVSAPAPARMPQRGERP